MTLSMRHNFLQKIYFLMLIWITSSSFIFSKNINTYSKTNHHSYEFKSSINLMVFPPNNVWNVRIDELPVHANSNIYIQSIGASTSLHPDFGTEYNGAPNGISYNLAETNQPMIPISFTWPDESDAGPYPIPSNPLIEGLPYWTSHRSGDRHLIVIDPATSLLYETWNTWPNPDNSNWSAGSGAIFDLSKNKLRPESWTSADAAGLPIYPGLIRYDEVQSGEITHAIRFTAQQTQKAYIWPARHHASSLTSNQYPPMGQRFRLKSNFDISSFSPEIKVILRAFKRYGIILADNGSDWYISGSPDTRWDDDILRELINVQGSDFEAIDISTWLNDPNFNPNSGAVPNYIASVDVDPSLTNIFPTKNENIKGKQTYNYSPANTLDQDIETYFKPFKNKSGKLKITLDQNQTIQQIRIYINHLTESPIRLKWKIYYKNDSHSSWTFLEKNVQTTQSSQWVSSQNNLNTQALKFKIVFINKKINGRRGTFGIGEIEGYQ